MLHIYLRRVLVILDAVFVVVQGPSDLLWMSLESKPDGYRHTWHDVVARDSAESGWLDGDGIVTRSMAEASECKQQVFSVPVMFCIPHVAVIPSFLPSISWRHSPSIRI